MGNCASGMKAASDAFSYEIATPKNLSKVEIPTGSLINMLKQDPTVEFINHRLFWIPDIVRPGPQNKDIKIAGYNQNVEPTDYENNYLYDPEGSPLAFDAANTFAIVYQVLSMYRRALNRMKSGNDLQWNWGKVPIKVYPRAGEWANAFYSRDEQALAFFYFTDKNTGETVYTSRSFDIVAHEAGHAVLDGLKPSWITADSPEIGALHESFGDLTVIFALMEQMDMCDSIVTLSKGDLHSKNFFQKIAEQMGSSIGGGTSLRNADNDKKMDEVTDEIHDLSQVFTGAVYDVIVDIFEGTRDLRNYEPSETLFRIGKRLCAVLIIAIFRSSNDSTSFAEVAENMINIEPKPAYQSIMRMQFTRRKIFDPTARPRPSGASSSAYMGYCGTHMAMQKWEQRENLREKIRNIRSTSLDYNKETEEVKRSWTQPEHHKCRFSDNNQKSISSHESSFTHNVSADDETPHNHYRYVSRISVENKDPNEIE